MSDVAEVESVVDEIEAQRHKAEQRYGALLTRVAGGGKAEEGDFPLLASLNKSKADFAWDLETRRAELADGECAAVAKQMRELRPAADKLAAEIDARDRAMFEALRTFAAAFFGQLDEEITTSRGVGSILDTEATRLTHWPNTRALSERRAAVERLKAEHAAIAEANRVLPLPDKWSDDIAKLRAAERLDEIDRLSRPFPAITPELPPAYIPKTLPELVGAAMAAVTAEQRQTLAEVARAITESTTER